MQAVSPAKQYPSFIIASPCEMTTVVTRVAIAPTIISEFLNNHFVANIPPHFTPIPYVKGYSPKTKGSGQIEVIGDRVGT